MEDMQEVDLSSSQTWLLIQFNSFHFSSQSRKSSKSDLKQSATIGGQNQGDAFYAINEYCEFNPCTSQIPKEYFNVKNPLQLKNAKGEKRQIKS